MNLSLDTFIWYMYQLKSFIEVKRNILGWDSKFGRGRGERETERKK